jgi:hypothetical protein
VAAPPQKATQRGRRDRIRIKKRPRRAHEILTLGIEEEQFLKDVPFNRLHHDAELHDIISLTDKDNRIDKTLFKVLGLRDVIDIGGVAETTATGLMKLRTQ